MALERIAACPLCHGESLDLIRTEASGLPAENPYFQPYGDAPIHLRRCRACEFAFVDQLPADPAFYQALYSHQCNWEVEVDSHGKGLIHEHARRVILKYQPGGRLLDVGAWVGGFLQVMADRFDGKGVEIDGAAAAVARRRGIDVTPSSFLEAQLPSHHFDAVTLIDVLEHLADPARHLHKAREVLKSGGVLFVKVPNYVAQMNKQDLKAKLGISRQGIMGAYVHINHFSRRSLSAYLTGIGFEILESGFTPGEIWNSRLKGTPGQKLRRKIANACRRAGTFLANQASRLLRRELGLNLYVIARKRG